MGTWYPHEGGKANIVSGRMEGGGWRVAGGGWRVAGGRTPRPQRKKESTEGRFMLLRWAADWAARGLEGGRDGRERTAKPQ
ncbi:MAG: hypothetical protein WCK00_13910, partial [Deltaproteobacteria bacterium]